MFGILQNMSLLFVTFSTKTFKRPKNKHIILPALRHGLLKIIVSEDFICTGFCFHSIAKRWHVLHLLGNCLYVHFICLHVSVNPHAITSSIPASSAQTSHDGVMDSCYLFMPISQPTFSMLEQKPGFISQTITHLLFHFLILSFQARSSAAVHLLQHAKSCLLWEVLLHFTVSYERCFYRPFPRLLGGINLASLLISIMETFLPSW